MNPPVARRNSLQIAAAIAVLVAVLAIGIASSLRVADSTAAVVAPAPTATPTPTAPGVPTAPPTPSAVPRPTATPLPNTESAPTPTAAPGSSGIGPASADVDIWIHGERGTGEGQAVKDLVEFVEYGPYREDSFSVDDVLLEDTIDHIATFDTDFGPTAIVAWELLSDGSDLLSCMVLVDGSGRGSDCSANPGFNRIEAGNNRRGGREITVVNPQIDAHTLLVTTDTGFTVQGPIVRNVGYVVWPTREGEPEAAQLLDEEGTEVYSVWFDSYGFARDEDDRNPPPSDIVATTTIEPLPGAPTGDIYVRLGPGLGNAAGVEQMLLDDMLEFIDTVPPPDPEIVAGTTSHIATLEWSAGTVNIFVWDEIIEDDFGPQQAACTARLGEHVLDSGCSWDSRPEYDPRQEPNQPSSGWSPDVVKFGVENTEPDAAWLVVDTIHGVRIVANVQSRHAFAVWRREFGLVETAVLLDADFNEIWADY